MRRNLPSPDIHTPHPLPRHTQAHARPSPTPHRQVVLTSASLRCTRPPFGFCLLVYVSVSPRLPFVVSRLWGFGFISLRGEWKRQWNRNPRLGRRAGGFKSVQFSSGRPCHACVTACCHLIARTNPARAGQFVLVFSTCGKGNAQWLTCLINIRGRGGFGGVGTEGGGQHTSGVGRLCATL